MTFALIFNCKYLKIELTQDIFNNFTDKSMFRYHFKLMHSITESLEKNRQIAASDKFRQVSTWTKGLLVDVVAENFGWFWIEKQTVFGWICFEYKNKPHFFSGCSSVTHLIFTSFQLFLALTWSLKVDPFLLTSLRKSWQYPQCQAIEVQRNTGVWNIS